MSQDSKTSQKKSKIVQVENLVKKYGQNTILDDVTMHVNHGDVVGIIGPSGSGKSTILRCINGLEEYDSGTIQLEVKHKYKVGTVFQRFNLFENMNVMENLSYPQRKVLGKCIEDAKGFSMYMLKKVGLPHLLDRYPANLSSGQKQRVAIARTLCMKPEIILFDEPTSALDPENVADVLDLIRSLVDDNITMVIVTHEIKFIKAIANRIIFFENGQIVEGMDSEVFFYKSGNERVENFLEKLRFYDN